MHTTEKQKHLNHIRNLNFDCTFMLPILNSNEYEDLKKYGSWMMALYNQEIIPITNAQIKFCESLDTITPPNDYFSNLFWRYLKRRTINNTQILNNKKHLVKDDREDWKKIRNMRF